MRQAITTQDEFNQKAKNSKGGVLLLFHSDNTAEERLQKYQDQAEDKCGPNYRVFTVNIDHIILSSEDISKYQHGKDVVWYGWDLNATEKREYWFLSLDFLKTFDTFSALFKGE